MLAILNSLNAHNLLIFQPILMKLVSKFMVYRALSDKRLGLLSPLNLVTHPLFDNVSFHSDRLTKFNVFYEQSVKHRRSIVKVFIWSTGYPKRVKFLLVFFMLQAW